MNISIKYKIGQLVEAKWTVGENIFGIIKRLTIEIPHSSEEDGVKYQVGERWVNESEIIRVIEDR